MPHLTRNEWKGLWSVLWRVLIFGPIVGVFGLALLALVFAAFFAQPIYAVLALLGGDWLPGIAALATWAVVLHFRRPIAHWALEGIKYISI